MELNNYAPFFKSPLSEFLEKFINEKQACGYKYYAETKLLESFDQFLVQEKLINIELPEGLVKHWVAKREHGSAGTQRHRIGIVRQFSEFLVQLDYPAYIIPKGMGAKNTSSFLPYIFTQNEIEKIIGAIDKLKPTARSPMRHIIMPEIFRLLYHCGFRVNEVLKLRNDDVDLNQGIIIIHQGKFNKDRLVPITLDSVKRLREYIDRLRPIVLVRHNSAGFFFPSEIKGHYSIQAVYELFRQSLHQCGISHGGRGKGPRIHDLRHTFAVHKLIQWYKEGADLSVKLPLLSTYLGHQNLQGTQHYLHLTAELLPYLAPRLNEQFGSIIPMGGQS